MSLSAIPPVFMTRKNMNAVHRDLITGLLEIRCEKAENHQPKSRERLSTRPRVNSRDSSNQCQEPLLRPVTTYDSLRTIRPLVCGLLACLQQMTIATFGSIRSNVYCGRVDLVSRSVPWAARKPLGCFLSVTK